MFKRIVPFVFFFSAMGSAFAADFEVHSDDLKTGVFNQTQIANGFGCQGGNVSPQIAWSGAPAGTKSFLITMYDPDAPTGSGFWHWILANVPANTQSLPRGAGNDSNQLPAGTLQISNDTGKPGYLGPCPPTGETHRYQISVIALKVDKLDIDPQATPAVTGFTAHFQTLGKATMTARFGR
ncbi:MULTISPECIES: YbhB/YbcL family Raf kinase inhibitor-like protein [Silvimonas]|uniref:YbhB/YbcL family Raf kinase inhibitor-like protein n=1 Tax=Silvimonas TaxID=300264 RepID=UPI0024B37DA7|nr:MULTISPECIES: YbhB/YbcL family Raf kinase inhibitor-like protein [Silvimonas]MDR3428266.1 YbhB/YbcL family Raf kinase inhibitor-like protein [Silvimonas sp.]